MHKEQNHNTWYNVVHPQCRGYVHRTVFIQLFTKTTVLICALSCRSLQVLKATHTAADFLNHPKPSAHIAAEVVHAHIWDLTFLTKQSLASHQFILHQKPNLTLLQKCLFIQVHLLQNYGIKPWAPRTLNPGFKPWVYYKESFYSTSTPLRLFWVVTLLTISTKTVELPKLGITKVHAPTCP